MELMLSIVKNRSLNVDHYRYAATVKEVKHHDTSGIVSKTPRSTSTRLVNTRSGDSGYEYHKTLITLLKCFQNKNSDIPIVLNHCLPIVKSRIQLNLNYRRTINHLLACLKEIYHNPSNVEDLESMIYQFIFQLNSIDEEFNKKFQNSIMVELSKKSNTHIKMLILIYNIFPYDEENHLKMLKVLTLKHTTYCKTFQILNAQSTKI